MPCRDHRVHRYIQAQPHTVSISLRERHRGVDEPHVLMTCFAWAWGYVELPTDYCTPGPQLFSTRVSCSQLRKTRVMEEVRHWDLLLSCRCYCRWSTRSRRWF
jgi:hypothetical protein